MKIAIGSLSHESNSFNPQQMTLDDFAPVYGQEVLELIQVSGETALKGIYDVLNEASVKIVPTIYARTTPGGLVSHSAYEVMKANFLAELQKEKDLDAICLHLHGSMTVADLGDAEGDLLSAIRELVGADLPIVTSLDMHATLTITMLEHADAFVGYRTAPHVDMIETGQKAAEILLDALRGKYKLQMAFVGLPLLVSGEQSESSKEPMASLFNYLAKVDSIPNVVSSSLFLGFPWVDVDYNQGSALVVTRDKPELAVQEALSLAEKFWSKLPEFKFTTEAYPFPKALQVALDSKKVPVCIADCGDNPGAGGSQDIVLPLQHMLERGLENILFGAIADPIAYEFCSTKDVGDSFSLKLGRLSIGPNALGLKIDATLTHKGQLNQRPAVVVQTSGIDIVISQGRVMMLDPQDLEKLGLTPTNYRILVLKSGYLDPKYEAIAGYGLLALTTGYTNQIFVDLEYKNVPRPIYPLDQGFTFKPEEYLVRPRNTKAS